jgi:hypothetical protein
LRQRLSRAKKEDEEEGGRMRKKRGEKEEDGRRKHKERRSRETNEADLVIQNAHRGAPARATVNTIARARPPMPYKTKKEDPARVIV